MFLPFDLSVSAHFLCRLTRVCSFGYLVGVCRMDEDRLDIDVYRLILDKYLLSTNRPPPFNRYLLAVCIVRPPKYLPLR